MNYSDIDDIKNDYNWKEAFEYSPVPIGDVIHTIASVDGENDEENWVGLFITKDYKFLTLSAGCDYTGWDCQASGNGDVHNSLKAAVQSFGDSERKRLGLKMVY